MTHTVESLMALHDEVVGRSKLTEEGEAEARSRFLAALTEALAPTFQPDWADFENGRECGRLEAAQPNIQNYPEKDILKPDQQLCGFYQVSSFPELVTAMERHIDRLQAKLPPLRDTQPGRVREG